MIMMFGSLKNYLKRLQSPETLLKTYWLLLLFGTKLFLVAYFISGVKLLNLFWVPSSFQPELVLGLCGWLLDTHMTLKNRTLLLSLAVLDVLTIILYSIALASIYEFGYVVSWSQIACGDSPGSVLGAFLLLFLFQSVGLFIAVYMLSKGSNYELVPSGDVVESSKNTTTTITMPNTGVNTASIKSATEIRKGKRLMLVGVIAFYFVIALCVRPEGALKPDMVGNPITNFFSGITDLAANGCRNGDATVVDMNNVTTTTNGTTELTENKATEGVTPTNATEGQKNRDNETSQGTSNTKTATEPIATPTKNDTEPATTPAKNVTEPGTTPTKNTTEGGTEASTTVDNQTQGLSNEELKAMKLPEEMEKELKARQREEKEKKEKELIMMGQKLREAKLKEEKEKEQKEREQKERKEREEREKRDKEERDRIHREDEERKRKNREEEAQDKLAREEQEKKLRESILKEEMKEKREREERERNEREKMNSNEQQERRKRLEGWYKHCHTLNDFIVQSRSENQTCFPNVTYTSDFSFLKRKPTSPIKNVVVFFLETTRSDAMPFDYTSRLAKNLTPEAMSWRNVTKYMSSLIGKSRYNTNAKATSTVTLKSMLSGLCSIYPYPENYGPEARYNLYRTCLPELLQKYADMSTAFMQPHDLELFEQDRIINKNGFSEVYNSRRVKSGEFGLPRSGYINCVGYEDRVLEKPLHNWLVKQRKSGKPFFLAYGTSATHMEFGTPPQWPIVKYVNTRVNTFVNERINKYLNALAYVDDFIGAVMADFKAQGLTKDTLFIFIGDHGVALNEHGSWYTTDIEYETDYDIPIMFYTENEAWNKKFPPGRFYEQWSELDLVPTILDALKFDGDNTNFTDNYIYEGQSLLRDKYETRVQVGLSNPGMSSIVLREGSKKLVTPGTAVRTEKFYDLAKDPLEYNPMKYEQLSTDLQKWVREMRVVRELYVSKSTEWYHDATRGRH